MGLRSRVMDVTVKKVNEHIIHVKFETGTDMTETLIRYQEYYESPSKNFRGNIFTLGMLRKWYTKKFGGFTYYTDYSGFNLPSHVLNPFKEGLFDPLTEKEKYFLDMFKDRTDKFYIIATASKEDEENSFNHELLHALYYTNKNYKTKANKILKGVDLKSLYKGLKKIGYCDDVLLDEAQAYMGSDTTVLYENKIDFSVNKAQELEKLARRYLSRLKNKRL